ncbi:hypothetical protein DFR42_10722 [Undibacterium pigrum]|uniref:Uncharacterized protein n=1 Tax=Undibacterium pigrum TaxID=401470 RepID=A0A318J3W2_9BURK|nr:hypothetical protein DFR42_10722 [Undibacterium pigrum]
MPYAVVFHLCLKAARHAGKPQRKVKECKLSISILQQYGQLHNINVNLVIMLLFYEKSLSGLQRQRKNQRAYMLCYKFQIATILP